MKTSIRRVRIGNVLHIYAASGAPEIGKFDKELAGRISSGLAKGLTVEENGVSSWYDDREIVDTTKTGSAVYTWRGDKVKCERVLVQKAKDGKITRTHVKFVWKAV